MGATLVPHGIAFVAIESPGTGQSPIKADATAERMYKGVIDYLVGRPDIDRNRILVHGQSFGAYWAAKLAHTERARLAGVVAQSPAVHTYFRPDFFAPSLYTRAYLFDHLSADLNVYGQQSRLPLNTALPTMSL